MTEEEYKEEGAKFLEVILKYFPKKIIVDGQDMLFPVVPELQEWTNETIFAKGIAIGLNKMSIVMSKDLFTQVSVEQLIDEAKDAVLLTRYFDDKAQAKEWILSV